VKDGRIAGGRESFRFFHLPLRRLDLFFKKLLFVQVNAYGASKKF